jgi:hypothetical protein
MACCSGVKGLGKFIPGNFMPTWIEAKQRSGTPGNWVRTSTVKGLGQSFDINLGMTQWISGIPNLYLLAGGAIVVILMTRR